MPADRANQERRKEAIREILQEEGQTIEEQKDLVERLRERGIQATQSSVSRDLRDLGAVRSKGHYTIPSWADEEEEEQESPFRKVVPFIGEVRQAGPYQTLLLTVPGAGGIVAQAIDDAEWEDVVGTVAGVNSVLILTENIVFQKLVFQRLKWFMETETDE
jgi:transcriptional regulator of arginine metabolism